MQNNEPVSTDTASLPKNGLSKTIQLSSNTTLMWRVFVPVFFTVLLICIALAFFLTNEDDVYLSYPIWVPRLLFALVLVGWIWFVQRTIWRLMRVESNSTHVYISNFWHTVRYPWEDVAHITETTRLGRRIVQFHLHAKGRFGKKISFLPGNDYNDWKSQNKSLLDII